VNGDEGKTRFAIVSVMFKATVCARPATWIFAGVVALSGCGDDTTAGAGGGGTGGANAGGANTGGTNAGGGAPCTATTDCAASEFCAFADGKCGAGNPGACTARPDVCSDGPITCFCDGAVSDLGCAGLNGVDLDHTGEACTAATTVIKCGAYQCDGGTTDFCELLPNDSGGPPAGSCNSAPAGCDPAECACLTQEIQSCAATCEDTAAGPIITCAGG